MLFQAGNLVQNNRDKTTLQPLLKALQLLPTLRSTFAEIQALKVRRPLFVEPPVPAQADGANAGLKRRSGQPALLLDLIAACSFRSCDLFCCPCLIRCRG